MDSSLEDAGHLPVLEAAFSLGRDVLKHIPTKAHSVYIDGRCEQASSNHFSDSFGYITVFT